ncbi:hypothetical protein [Puniceicoccus vermicola]|uniref:Uncharacterized protein n=1 Tax=Puniceicoccus vermicola TaxID=388746 RepID=A0A7X1E3B7_9BACT|nr:hypothetical protein [Puniceicoccus vermicola]MBC2600813.1 hypothetical protein [Puniceicoccus vermicola]
MNRVFKGEEGNGKAGELSLSDRFSSTIAMAPIDDSNMPEGCFDLA